MRRLSSRKGQIIYGPIFSRRIGVDIGINLLIQAGKTCTYNCVYCQYGTTGNLISKPEDIDGWVAVEDVLNALRDALEAMVSEGENLDSITFSGYGEPTLHPDFEEAVIAVSKLRDEYYPDVPITIITNSSLAPIEHVKAGLLRADRIIAKVDVGSAETWRKINRPAVGVPNFDEIIESLKEISDIAREKLTIQTLILNGAVNNSSEDELKRIAERIAYINPHDVQVYTIVRGPAEDYVKPVSVDILRKLQNFILKLNKKILVRVY
ncbi:MAG: radical SAM protein [Candidatus Odinarchaeia archaeon]